MEVLPAVIPKKGAAELSKATEALVLTVIEFT